MFVAHDISMVHQVSHRVVVLRKGSIVEDGDDPEVTTEPKTRYTHRLMLAAPVPDPVRQAERRARLRAIEAA
jgi:peptide/nickel transport system ATP-binding protein